MVCGETDVPSYGLFTGAEGLETESFKVSLGEEMQIQIASERLLLRGYRVPSAGHRLGHGAVNGTSVIRRSFFLST